MEEEYLISKYEKYGEKWQIDFIKRELNKINSSKDINKTLEQINYWGEYCENQTGNLNISQVEAEKYSIKSHMYAELSYLEIFKK